MLRKKGITNFKVNPEVNEIGKKRNKKEIRRKSEKGSGKSKIEDMTTEEGPLRAGEGENPRRQ